MDPFLEPIHRLTAPDKLSLPCVSPKLNREKEQVADIP